MGLYGKVNFLAYMCIYCANHYVVTSTGNVTTTLSSQTPKVILHIEDRTGILTVMS